MTGFLPRELREELRRAQERARSVRRRLTLRAGPTRLPLLAFDRQGLEVAESAPPLGRGRVEILEGGRLLYTALVVLAGSGDGRRRYEFKWLEPAHARPPADHAGAEDAPAAFLPAPA